MKIRKICIFCILGIMLFSLTGCSNDDNINLETKANTEIEYLDRELITIMSKLNNITFSNYIVEAREVDLSSSASDKNSSNSESQQNNSSKNGSSSSGNEQGGSSDSGASRRSNGQKINVTEMVNQTSLSANFDDINWNGISTNLETFYTSWNTIILDLYKLNIDAKNITNFSSELDKLVINIKNQDKKAALTSAVTLYSYLPQYLQTYSTQNELKNLSLTKFYILNAYVATSLDDWEKSNSELALAEQAFSNIMKNTEYVIKKEYNVNKVYVTLKELQTSNQYQDKTIFFLKYKNVMQEIEIL